MEEKNFKTLVLQFPSLYFEAEKEVLLLEDNN